MAQSLLSPRQKQCLCLAAKGLTSREIAEALDLSPRTVDEYIAKACAKLGVRTRIQAVGEAVRRGLITLGEP